MITHNFCFYLMILVVVFFFFGMCSMHVILTEYVEPFLNEIYMDGRAILRFLDNINDKFLQSVDKR